ncbi:hypothetical protein ACIBG8_24115 [Nonomuraea sp. NPDC050556]|uniref:hypothetical protein n=1 Tax=Nonomuraea sp. NPDC050556 TaxID=3364369 RepID=UPI0037BC0FC7
MVVKASPAVAQPGQPIEYKVTVRNAGPGDAVLPVLKVLIPRDVDIVGVDVATCRPGRTPSEVICPSPVDVLVGGTGAVTINGVVRPGARGPLRAVASLTSEVEDANEADNTHAAITKVDEGADLGLRLTGRSRPGRFSVAAVVRNRGPRTVRDAYVMLRAGSARLISGPCYRRYRWLTCRVRPVESGEQVRLSLALRAPRVPVRAEASVFSAGLGDRRPTNNRAMMRIAR